MTTVARTILDLAAELAPSELEQAVAETVRKRLTSPTALEALAARHPRRPGTPALRAVLDCGERPAFVRSELERRFLELIRRARLPAPEVNGQLAGHEIDFLWRDQRLAVEVDGDAFHSARPDRRRDQARDAELLSLGYTVPRLSWHQVSSEPEATISLVARLLERGVSR